MRNTKKVLVISPHYHTVPKDLSDSTANYVSNITVLVHHNYLSEIARHLPFSCIRHVEKWSKEQLVDLKQSPKNVKVYTNSMLYFIPDGSNIGLGDKLFERYRNTIEANKIEFDLIHAHFIWPCGYVGVKLAEKCNVPMIVTAHGFDAYELPFRSQFWFNRVNYILDNTSHIITVSTKIRNIIVRKLGISANKVSVIPNGFNSKLFYIMDKIKVRQDLFLPLNKKIILNVANLVPVKGHSYLIEAMRKIVEERKDVLCVIVGDDILRTDLENQIKNLNLRAYIKLVGAKPHNEISLWINACDLFVLPSLNEGNPTVMFEALGCGKPFVGTKVGGVSEIIINDKLGILVEPKDPEALAQSVLRALETKWDEEYILGYAEQFTWDNIAKRIMEVYAPFLKK